MKPLNILLFLALALPAFADSITDLGPETHTSYFFLQISLSGGGR